MCIRDRLNDVRVRQALQFAKDAPAINDTLYDGLYQASDGALNNIHPCYWDGSAKLYPHDPAKAAALLDEAGWLDDGTGIRKAKGVEGVADGTPLTIRWTTLHHQEIGEVVQAPVSYTHLDVYKGQAQGLAGPWHAARGCYAVWSRRM